MVYTSTLMSGFCLQISGPESPCQALILCGDSDYLEIQIIWRFRLFGDQIFVGTDNLVEYLFSMTVWVTPVQYKV